MFVLQDGTPLRCRSYTPWRSHAQTEDEDGSQAQTVNTREFVCVFVTA